MYTLNCAGAYSFSAPGGGGGVYVVDLVRLPAGLAAASSDQKISLLDIEHLRGGPVVSLPTNHGSVRALAALDWAASVVATAGDDGAVNVWDMRAGGRVGGMEAAPRHAVLSLACQGQTVAVGTDLQNHEAVISIWDLRAPTLVRQYQEVHSDDVTEVRQGCCCPARRAAPADWRCVAQMGQ
jgi:WD40 repeat protein